MDSRSLGVESNNHEFKGAPLAGTFTVMVQGTAAFSNWVNTDWIKLKTRALQAPNFLCPKIVWKIKISTLFQKAWVQLMIPISILPSTLTDTKPGQLISGINFGAARSTTVQLEHHAVSLMERH